MARHKTLEYLFEQLPLMLPGRGARVGMARGKCLVEYDPDTRGFSITTIWVWDEGPLRLGMVQLEPDLGYLQGTEGFGPYEMAHASLTVDREDKIGELVDLAIDNGGHAA